MGMHVDCGVRETLRVSVGGFGASESDSEIVHGRRRKQGNGKVEAIPTQPAATCCWLHPVPRALYN